MQNRFLKTLASSSDLPVILAPLAGVSDVPFRLVCQEQGADLTYVEMLSATALLYQNIKTLEMARRHPEELKLGVQVTGRNAAEVAGAIELLNRGDFDTIDINMGCPVKKIVGTGCGSAILREPQRVFDTVRLAKSATDKPLSAKIRLGWNHQEKNYLEIGQAIQEAGADWICVHGRTRSDSYADPVDLDALARLKKMLIIPMIANGNLFHSAQAGHVRELTACDGVMISRGALGNPWVFAEIRGLKPVVSPAVWGQLVMRHLDLQGEAYGETGRGIICMRKHLGWYLKGWPDAKEVREKAMRLLSISEAKHCVADFVQHLEQRGVEQRSQSTRSLNSDFSSDTKWDPKYDMDRVHDKGEECEIEQAELELGLV